MHAMQAILLCK